jgi:hypothetical protein
MLKRLLFLLFASALAAQTAIVTPAVKKEECLPWPTVFVDADAPKQLLEDRDLYYLICRRSYACDAGTTKLTDYDGKKWCVKWVSDTKVK